MLNLRVLAGHQDAAGGRGGGGHDPSAIATAAATIPDGGIHATTADGRDDGQQPDQGEQQGRHHGGPADQLKHDKAPFCYLRCA